MKQFYIVLLLLVSVNIVVSQKTMNCFESTYDAKKIIEGEWKEKRVRAKFSYKFVISDENINMEILENLDYFEDQDSKNLFNVSDSLKIVQNGKCYQVGVLKTAKYGSEFQVFDFVINDEFFYQGITFLKKLTN